MRVFELAKDLSVDTKDLLKIAKDLAISVENNMSMLDVHDIDRIKKRFQKDNEKHPDQPSEDVYVDKRVSSTVIRRRARVSAPSQEKPEGKSEEAAPLEPGVEAQPISEKKTEKKKKAAKVGEEIDGKPVQEQEAAAEEKKAPAEEPVIETKKEAAPPIETPHKKEKKKESAPPVIPEEKPAAPAVSETEKKEEDDKKKKDKKKGKKAKVEGVEAEPEGGDKLARLVTKKAKKPWEREVYTQTDLYGADKSAYGKKLKNKKKDRSLGLAATPLKKKKIFIGKTITVANLAKEMGVKASDAIKVLMELGVMASQNQYITSEEAVLVAHELGYEVEETRDEIKETYLTPPSYTEEELEARPPVVTVMGHVDHGKTSLLDAIRTENVVDKEFGGITQHIGAYQAQCKGKPITFIDTPGHEAFTSMRSRGAQVTDFVVLVVAADDGVMDQTKEAINHARAANIPILIAVNKIDKPNANPQRVREQLSDLGLVPEAWGGDAIYIDVSAKNRIGIEDLLEMILLQAEIMDIKAYSKGAARGVVLESKLDKARGPMASVLIQSGHLKRGDIFVVGNTWGKARAMFDFTGKAIEEALPATPVELLGFTALPSAGDTFFVVPNEKKAKEIISYFQDGKEIVRQQKQETKEKVTLEDLYSQVQEGKIKDLNLIIKGDVHGSVEAIQGSVKGIDTGQDLRINVIHSAVGGITENDILLASTANAIVLGFNVRPEPSARALAKKYNVDIKLYTIIYDLIEDIKHALTGMLEPVYEEVIQGRAEVRDLFKVPKMGVIAGCMVTDGQIQRGSGARLLRDNVVVYQGKIESLRRFKDDAREVASGYECGVGFGSYNDIKVGDVIETFSQQKVETEHQW